ncbi:MAG: peptidylprolyl isomerase, partial [Sulfuricellaceae bacterium]|nr:peptidylprolyl isomerase [Sulfuricellaceae bacterium]
MQRTAALFAVLLFSGSALAEPAHPLVEMKTNLGTVTFELFPEKAPKTVENFLKYVQSGYYKGTIFHRAVKNFIVQGGAYTPDLTEKPTLAPIPNEAGNGLLNLPGTLAMSHARDPQSATSQFFVNLDDNKFLNHYRNDADYYGYCVFGKVVEGMAVFKKIASLPTAPKAFLPGNVPLENVVIEDTSVVSSVNPNAKMAEGTATDAKP